MQTDLESLNMFISTFNKKEIMKTNKKYVVRYPFVINYIGISISVSWKNGIYS